MANKLTNFFKTRNFILFILAVGIIIFGFYFWLKKEPELAKPVYTQGYHLVNEKISQSAAIAIHLPTLINKEIAQQNTTFFPEIKGKWLASNGEKDIVFQPDKELELNRYYSVQLTLSQSEETVVKSDFLAVEDPEIIAIFPKEDSEAPEDSEITLVFNRPMVPLTTLSYLEEQEIPIEIAPSTKGRFKWITTRNLQFIPEERLIRSSHYTVKIKSGLVSMDNLKLERTERNFITRRLRYVDLSRDKTAYDRPISIYFNQPVDLERTKAEISLMNSTTGKTASFIAEYRVETEKESEQKKDWIFGNINIGWFIAGLAENFGINQPSLTKARLAEAFGEAQAREEDNVNKSIIQIYNKEDRFGREKFWDFENKYFLTINRAYPEEGDIILDESRTANIYVPGIIQDITAESERTRYAAPDFFDPRGKLWVDFYEEIDLEKSQIKAQKMKEIGYAEKCLDEEQNISQEIECEKISDKKRIYLTFQEEKIGLGETLEINFEKIVNIEGLTVNQELIKRYITSYPEFKVLGTSPANNSMGASLTNFVFCSNSPIAVPAEEDYEKYFKVNLDYEFNNWGSSWKVTNWYSGEQCRVGEFHTALSYGLMPLSDYSLEFKLEDVFGQKLSFSLGFTSGEMSGSYLNFFHFQRPYYSVTSAQKTILTYAASNMEYVNMEICKLKPLDFLYNIEEKPGYNDPPSKITNCQKIIRDRIELPKRFWVKNYFKVDIKDYFEEPLGHYILTFGHPDYTAQWREKKQIYERTYLTVTNLAAAEKRILPQYADYGSKKALTTDQLSQLNNLYWVTDIGTLEPISGAGVELFQRTSEGSVFRLISSGSYSTNDQGIALTRAVVNLRGAIITKGNDSAVIPNNETRLDWVSSAFSARKIYLYTDKPIYRPGQEVFIKGIYRVGYDGDYEIYQGKPVTLKAYNSRYDEIFNRKLEVSDFGTFDTKISLDAKGPLGTYRFCIGEDGQDSYECGYFDVQEYVPAPFEVNVKTDKEEYISKDTANLEIEANYYFGVPLEEGEVTYNISSQDYYFDRYADDYFNFGQGWYYWSPHPYGDKFILRGRTSLNGQGKAEISQLFDFESLFKNEEDRKSKIIVVDITVKNSEGQSVSAQKSFIVHSGDFYLGLRLDKSFLAKNEKFNLRVKSVDVQGKETGVKNITLNLYKIDWIYSKRQGADGGYYYNWEEKKDLAEKHNFDTDKQGNFVKELKIAEEGSYKTEVAASDKKGNLVRSTYNLYVYGEKEVSVRPTKDTQLEIEPENIDLNVGEEGRIIIKSPYSRAMALISIERGKIFNYQIKEIKGNLYNFNFRIKEEYIPNVYVSVLLLSSDPEIKFGRVEFKINTKQRELEVDIKSNKNQYLPGEEVVLDISTKDYQGKPVSAELSVAIVDLSVLALKGNPKKNPIVFFYGGFPLTVSTASNIKEIMAEYEVPTKGGGGGAEEALARKKRGEFKETAFWQAVVRTDENGKAQVKFTLPDNLTAWQTEALGLTKDTKLGVGYQEFLTRKELMVVPLKPRFVIPGDVFFIGAKLFNQSKDKQKLNLDVSFDSQTLVLKEDKKEKEIKIQPEQTGTVYFMVEAPNQFETGGHKFVLSAKAGGLEDTVEQSISITRNDTYEVTATANYTSESISKEYVFLPDNIVKDKGELSIKASATLAVFLSDALNYLLEYPYGCTEQIASRLNGIAVVRRGLNLPNISDKFKLEKIKYGDKEYSIEEVVEIGLSEIYNNQRGDGGFTYWKGGNSDFHLTIHVVNALYELSLAGFDINQNSLKRGADYLYKEITTNWQLYQNKDTVILTAYSLFRLPEFTENYGQKQVLTQKIIEILNDGLFIHEQISNLSLSYLAILLTTGDFDARLKNKVFDTLDNRIDIDSRGAFLEISKNAIWRYYETPIKNTALYLKALVAAKNESPIMDKVLRWLLNSRAKDGAWGSTNNTITVIDALTDFLRWKRETESNFLLELFINGESETGFDFNPETILDQFKEEIPLQDLEFSKNNIIKFLKTNRNNLPNNLYYDIALRYYLRIEQIPPRDEGFSITREFYRLDDKENKNPLTEAGKGEVLRGHLQITVPKTRNFVTVEDYIPAGMEIVNLDLATEEKSLLLQEKELEGRELRPEFKEIRDDRVFLFKESLGPGVYEFDYYVRVLIKGKFNHLPAMVSEMYFPENFGRTSGGYFEVK